MVRLLSASPRRPFLSPDRSSCEVQCNTSPGIRSHMKHNADRVSVWRAGWKVPAGIIGFYLLALLLAVAHLCVFIHLNGRIINPEEEDLPFSSTTIRQAYATSFSLALITAFRSAIVASIGLCYTQCLWKKLRNELLSVELIEELFQVRSNALRMLKPAVMQHAPLLLSVALLSWLLPVAMIYPPGALIVGLDYHDVPGRFNVSVLPSSTAFDPFTEGSRDYPCRNTGLADICSYAPMALTSSEQQNFSYTEPLPVMLSVGNSVLASSKVLELARPIGLNAANISYTLSFQGPALACETDSYINRTSTRNGHIESYVLHRTFSAGNITDSKEDRLKLNMSYPIYHLDHGPGWIMLGDSSQASDFLSVSPCPTTRNETYEQGPSNSKTFPRFTLPGDATLLGKVTTKKCVAATAPYQVRISFTNGIQRVSCSTGKRTPLPKPTSNLRTLDVRPMPSIQEYVNLLAIVDSLGANLNLQGPSVDSFTFNLADLQRPAVHNFTDGKIYDACNAEPRYVTNGLKGSSIMALSAFNKKRASQTDLGKLFPEDFEMSEALLNEALANITISALTLGTMYEIVNGSLTRVFNVYHFDNRLSFYLPYGLCLLFTFPVLVLGLLALRHNGVTAIDGGFVQLLMTTTGRTKLERAAAQGCLGGEENIPKQLMKMKVRFGEMTTGDAVERAKLLPYECGGHHSDVDSENTIDEPNSHWKHNSTGSVTASPSDGHEADEGNVKSPVLGAERPEAGYQVIRRAGFGLVDETVPLERGVRCGSPEAEAHVRTV